MIISGSLKEPISMFLILFCIFYIFYNKHVFISIHTQAIYTHTHPFSCTTMKIGIYQKYTLQDSLCEPVKSLERLLSELRHSAPGSSLLLRVLHGGGGGWKKMKEAQLCFYLPVVQDSTWKQYLLGVQTIDWKAVVLIIWNHVKHPLKNKPTYSNVNISYWP